MKLKPLPIPLGNAVVFDKAFLSMARSAQKCHLPRVKAPIAHHTTNNIYSVQKKEVNISTLYPLLLFFCCKYTLLIVRLICYKRKKKRFHMFYFYFICLIGLLLLFIIICVLIPIGVAHTLNKNV